jgi:aspartyl/asparaginyl-tRNA synthetase
MISSPGALYGRHALSYTTDTVPIRLRWFDTPEVFLAESSQIYLELALCQHDVDSVYAIYNSFRHEPADATHLSEFHHIEFEGKCGFDEVIAVANGLVRAIVESVFHRADTSLNVFLTAEQRKTLETTLKMDPIFERLTLRDCYAMLYRDTGDDKYRDFTLAGRFGRWEEVRITELVGCPVAVEGFPLYEVAFYHDCQGGDGELTAANVDFIWSGYAEIIGAGRRISSVDRLQHKAERFALPTEDYLPYFQLRSMPGYVQSSGFGLGWERLVQGLLCLPSIDLACPFPRTHQGVWP